ncbi:MAG: DegT/DnrJ/EryC1/StrS family aminotransferase, partial [Planctomycetia bacterium]|nr:DegT/DnrJ/EryC1/StrS family aminotransferase [Planctomycetia bacterium]
MPRYGKEEIRNLTKVIESGVFCDTRGGFMDKFRADFAKALHTKHAICGATAMVLMHAIPGAIGAEAGDEIICDPVVQFHGIACLHNNVVPVWADVRKDNFLMDPKSVEKKITKRTKAIWVTHLWGFAAEVDKLRRIADKHGIYLLEDCAHAMLAKYKGKFLGNWGHIGTYSFNMGKQLPTGEGGMATTSDDRLAAEINRRIIFGESPEVLASNYRMTEFQAAVGVAQLRKVPGYLKTYRAGRKILDDAVKGCKWLDVRKAPADSTVSPYHWASIFRGERKGIDVAVFKAALTQAGGDFYIGFTQLPAYMYPLFRHPERLGRRGWPFGYKGRI